MKCKFSQVFYYHRESKLNPITKRIDIIGLDTEALTTGEPFMFALSNGEAYSMRDLLGVLFEKRFRGVRFILYNIKYDEGALLYHVPIAELNELRTTGKTYYEGYTYHSIPGKELRITKDKHTVAFYDICQFYEMMSLDSAANKYLGEGKIDIGSKDFIPHDVTTRWAKIAQYCVRDAVLTAKLADYFIDVLIKELGIFPQKLYSCGYIAGIHFSRTCEVVDVNRFWQHHKELLEYAWDAYAGGKFEIYQRGYGYFYQYDINSAYPSEIRNLQDVRLAKVIHSPKYHKGATYGFLKCRLTIGTDMFSPIAIKTKELNIYPSGNFVKTITKAEYDYIIEQGETAEIIDAWWLYCPKEYPYREEVDRIYKLKAELKAKGGDDKMRYSLTKKLLNSFYGKFIQVTAKHRDNGSVRYEAGYLFNPIYAAVITANTRLKVCRLCDTHPDTMVAVHTDSVVTTKALHTNGLRLNKAIGGWDLQNEGDGVIIGSGIYQVGDSIHYRGFQKIGSLIDIVNTKPHKINVEVPQTLVTSWRQVAFRNEGKEYVNRFESSMKVLNLHFDNKRTWQRKWDWSGGLVQSLPKFIIEPIEDRACGGLDNRVKV